MNPTPHSAYRPSTRNRIRAFVSVLESHKIPVTVRDTGGREIDAACGQLHWDAAPERHPVGDRELPTRGELQRVAG